MTTHFDDLDHERHMRESFELARKTAVRGDEPFGFAPVRDDEVIMRGSNRIVTESDIRHHPELRLVYRACREYDADERAAMVMYASTEPCLMRAGGMATARFARVMYGIGDDEIGEFTGSNPGVRSAAVLDAVAEVVGPVLNDEARRVHRKYEWQESANHRDERRLNRSANARSIERFEQSEIQ